MHLIERYFKLKAANVCLFALNSVICVNYQINDSFC